MVSPFEAFDLTGRTAVVTGGASGLGFQMSRALARAGATVLMGARREALLKESAERLMADPLIGHVHYRPVDLAQREAVRGFATEAIELLGGVDIFVGNAAVISPAEIGAITDASIDENMQVNLAANVQLVQAFVPHMRERRRGRIIFSSSIASSMGAVHQGVSMYSATKAALNGLARSLASDLGHDGITANAIVLGFFRSDMTLGAEQAMLGSLGEEVTSRFFGSLTESIALGRMGEPHEVEGLVGLLASDAGAFITGASIALDGGMGIMMRANHG